MSQPAEIVESPMPTSPEDLMARFSDLGIAYTLHHHEAVFTVEQSSKIDIDIPGAHCRNLFLRDKKKNNFLIVLRHETMVDMKKLPGVIGSDRLSFGSAERLWQYLGVRPGSVCPFAVINDAGNDVSVILERGMMEEEIVNYHPLLNTMTVSLKPADLTRFLESCAHAPRVIDLAPAAP